MERAEVYAAIDSEREYQARIWNSDTTTTGGLHSVTEFLVYIQDYTAEAMHMMCREADQVCTPKALNSMRKIAALAVSCMEQHGVKPR